MQNFKKEHPAIVLGLSTCGLGVVRSLGREKITIFSLDYEIKGHEAFYSKYAEASVCPHPVYNPEKLIEYLINGFGKNKKKPILFPTADEFVKFVSDYRQELKEYFLFNISSKEIIDNIIDKKVQYEQAQKAGINIAETYYPEAIEDVLKIKESIKYPAIIKGRYSFKWREAAGGTLKGFKVTNSSELVEKCREVFNNKVPVIIQRVITGPNTNHFKFCAYANKEGKMLAKFTLRKIRQYPIEFGIGSCVESLEYPQLKETGEKFFKGINYAGVGSAEFKLDAEDNRLKLIELNPRYWMQNEQAARAGVNFALTQYLDLSCQEINVIEKFKTGVRWIDPVLDFKSFLGQQYKGPLSLLRWLKEMACCEVFSLFSWQDLKPFLKSIKLRKKSFTYLLIVLKGKSKETKI